MFGPCRYHGCTAPATTIVVTWDGWCIERCEHHAMQIVDPLR